MIDSKKINEKFSFILVDDNEDKIYINEMYLKHFGINHTVITHGDYNSKLLLAVRDIHLERKFPVIFLDENFESSARVNGTEIVKNLASEFKKQGGILIPFSSLHENQLDSWSKEIKDSESWMIVNDTRLPYEYFTTGYIEQVCEKFSDNQINRESKSEIKLS